MKKTDHLPIFGVGPLYVYSIIILTIIGIVLNCLGLLDYGKFDILQLPFIIIGILLIIYGGILWCLSVFKAKIDANIKEKKLVTTGVYSIVRNPIYSGIAIALTGVCFIFNNLFLLVLPPIYWIWLTILLKHTEEKWLYEAFGIEYLQYCKRVNRCIPWWSKKN